MSLVGFRARNHGQQVGRRGALEKVDDRRTPRELWEPLNAEHRFTLDAAASVHNALCPMFYTIADNGLERSWRNHRVWCNPPYSDIRPWVEKAWSARDVERAERIVMLLPSNRTEQRWWQELVEPYRDNGGERELTVRFLAGRLRFDVPADTYNDPRGNRPPFGCCLLTWMAA